MATVSFEVPDDRYADFLRLAADFLDGRNDSSDRGRIDFEGDTALAKWRFEVLDKSDEDFRLMVKYLGRLKGLSAAVFDYLAEHPGPAEGDALAEWLQVESRRAVAGSLGHAARFANELGRIFPINWDRDSGSYWLDDDLQEAVRQARIWTVPKPYDYFLEINHRTFRYRSEDIPARYAIFLTDSLEDPDEALVGFFHDDKAVVGYHADAMSRNPGDYGFLRIEFTPDVVHRRHLVPLEPTQDLGTRTERSHDLVTFPTTDGFIPVDVQH